MYLRALRFASLDLDPKNLDREADSIRQRFWRSGLRAQRLTCDITHGMAAAENHPRGDLHAGTLACVPAITLGEAETIDVGSSTTMNVQSTRNNVDQPFVRALAFSDSDHIYVGVN